MKAFSLLMVVSFLVLAMSCGKNDGDYSQVQRLTDPRKPMAWGNQFEIYAFADNSTWEILESSLRNSLERRYFTTENEKYFDLFRGDPGSLVQFEKFRNLIFLAILDSDDKISTFIRERLSDGAVDKIRDDSVGFFSLNNPWANDQLVVVMVAVDLEILKNFTELQVDDVFQRFQDKTYHRIENQVYKFQIRDFRELRNFPFHIDIPANYLPYKQDADRNFNSYLARSKENPDRYLAMYYEDLPHDFEQGNIQRFLRDWAVETRRRIAWDYYDEDEFSDDDIRFKNYTLAGRQGVKFSGRWQNRKHYIGGAFQSFIIKCEILNKVIMIDNSVFYPQGYKLPALIELEVITRTLSLRIEEE